MRDRSHDEAMSEQLRADPAYVAELIADVLRHGSPAELDIVLRQLTYAAVAHDQIQRD
ncbi:DNA-binding phage protein [Rahnella inusitata]|nr:DNA-binding phage protein [Rahnella inusitata]